MIRFFHAFALLCTLHHFNFEHGDHASEREIEIDVILRHIISKRSLVRAA